MTEAIDEEDGAILLEVLVALVVLALVLGGQVAATALAARSIATAARRSDAYSLAAALLLERAAKPDGAVMVGGTPEGRRWRASIRPLEVGDLRKVEVEVTDASGHRLVHLATIVQRARP